MEHSHSLCLLEGEKSFPALYDMINQYISDGYAVVYSVESDLDSMVLHMTSMGVDVENFRRNGSLKLVDKNSFLSGNKKVTNPPLNSLRLVTSDLTEFKWVLYIGSNDMFLELNERESLLGYEKALSSPEMPLEIVCCYNAEIMTGLHLEFLVKVLNLHEYTLHHHHSQFVYHEWHPSKLIELLAKSMERAIGKESSDRLLNILKTLYKIDDPSLKYQNFENPLKELLGNSANVILNSLVEEIKQEIGFNLSSAY